MTCLIVENHLDSIEGTPRKANTDENFMEFKDVSLVKAYGCKLDVN